MTPIKYAATNRRRRPPCSAALTTCTKRRLASAHYLSTIIHPPTNDRREKSARRSLLRASDVVRIPAAQRFAGRASRPENCARLTSQRTDGPTEGWPAEVWARSGARHKTEGSSRANPARAYPCPCLLGLLPKCCSAAAAKRAKRALDWLARVVVLSCKADRFIGRHLV
uniref:Uncharacterized protein n=1 Tax=Plectus sambesii TaxID=2011161 RepID=A0A914VYU5_9BILA